MPEYEAVNSTSSRHVRLKVHDAPRIRLVHGSKPKGEGVPFDTDQIILEYQEGDLSRWSLIGFKIKTDGSPYEQPNGVNPYWPKVIPEDREIVEQMIAEARSVAEMP